MFQIFIVGRYSVGKSTLFNRITGKRNIVHKDPGITRDIIKEETEFQNINFTLVDSAGFENIIRTKDFIMQEKMILNEMRKSNKIIFVVDGETGLMPQDSFIASILRKEKLYDKVILAVNKADIKIFSVNDFYKLGIKKIMQISAETRTGVYELLEEVFSDYIRTKDEDVIESETRPEIPVIAMIGKPNVGKSTLFNTILGEQRALVSDNEFTTRDPLKGKITNDEDELIFIDTAGLRSSEMSEFGPVYLSMRRTENAIHGSDICLLMLDGSTQIMREDQRIGKLIATNNKACIVLVNKKDLMEDESKFIIDFNFKLRFLYYAPIIFISALNNINVKEIYKYINIVYKSYTSFFKTSTINKVIREIMGTDLPPDFYGKIYYVTQATKKPPKFILFVDNPKNFITSHINFLRKRMMDKLELTGSPIELEFRARR